MNIKTVYSTKAENYAKYRWDYAPSAVEAIFEITQLSTSFQFHQSWEEFIGAITSASYMPDGDNPLFKKLEREAKNIFSQYSDDGFLIVRGETELFIGQPVE